MRLRAKLRQRREEKRNKITNKNAIYAPRHKWHRLEGKCEPAGSVPLAYIMSYLLKMEYVVT